MIACDMDGTLLESDGNIKATVLEMIDELMRKGIVFTVASGRMPHRIDRLLLPHIGPKEKCYVANNGATVVLNGNVILDRTFPVRPYRNLILEYVKKGLEIDFDFNDEYRPLICTERTERHSNHFHGYDRPLGLGEDIWNINVNKISATDPLNDGKLLRFLEGMHEIGGCTVYGYGMHATEIGPENCSKMTGIKYLALHLGIDLSEILAIGDHTNDIEMLANCGYSACVANAVEESKSASKFICSASYGDGVVEAIRHYGCI